MRGKLMRRLIVLIGFECVMLVFIGLFYQLFNTAPNWSGSFICVLMMVAIACAGISIGHFIYYGDY